MLTRMLAVLFVVALTAPLSAGATDKGRELTWDDLMAPLPPEIEAKLKDLSDPKKTDMDAPDWEDKWDAVMAKAPSIVEELDGQQVRIPGYVVPVDLEADSVREFLLVPYVGACIHVPPPPPNQVVFVRTTTSYKVDELFDPVWVTGTIRVEKNTTDLAEAGYSLNATEVVRYIED